jgi:hypothetical protein
VGSRLKVKRVKRGGIGAVSVAARTSLVNTYVLYKTVFFSH